MSQDHDRDPRHHGNLGNEDNLKREHMNVYDVVAGRLAPRLLNQTYKDLGNEVKRNQIRPRPADDVLASFAAKDVTIPVEFHPELPSSDLLKALHYYTGEYFRHHDNYDGYRTLDETALLTLGVLMEEAIKDSLGPNGALAYAENEEETS
jgi:hypothetical protein